MEYDYRYTQLDANDYDNVNNPKESSLKKAQSLNVGYNRILICVQVNEKKTKQVEIGVYGSGSQGSQIRNAETGEYYRFLVGSSNEDLFFKTMICSGIVSNGPLTLFYDTPEQYERHQNTKLDYTTKKRWQDKKQHRLDGVNSNNK